MTTEKNGSPPVSPPAPGRKHSVFNLKETDAYHDWLVSISRDTLIPVSAIVRAAVGKWAQERGYPPPPR